MRDLRRRVKMMAAGLVLAGLALSGCGVPASSGETAGRTFGQLVRTIAGKQAVDESVVRTALAEQAEGASAQRALAEQWSKELPAEPLPKLESTWDDLGEYAVEQLRSATCEAVLDAISTQQIPNGQAFLENYVDGLITGGLPYAEEREIVEDFDELYQQAVDGDADAMQVRFTLMKIQYC
jgi:hypothetical protein